MTTLDATGPSGLTLRIEFVRLADRYGHVLSVVAPGGAVHPVLESVEGTATDDWPASPPLQSLSIEELTPGRLAALLVGLAGRSHWSASIEPVPDQAALDFDIACRTGNNDGPLGSTYQIVHRHPLDKASVIRQDAHREMALSLGENRHLSIHACTELDCGTTLGVGQRLGIAPFAYSGPLKGTKRWKYRVTLARA